MRNILQEGAAEAARLGFVKGEDAKQWRERDPEAAKRFAEWLRANHSAMVKAVARRVCES